MHPVILAIIGTYGTIALIMLLNRRKERESQERFWNVIQEDCRRRLLSKSKEIEKKECLPYEDDIPEEEIRVEEEDYDAYADEMDDDK